MKILILGAGAMGGYIGLRLLKAGEDVHFMVRESRLPVLRERGLALRSALGDVNVAHLPMVTNASGIKADVVIIACKAWDLENAMAAVESALTTDSLVVPLLNGVSHINRLAGVFGPERTGGGAVYTSATLGPDRTILHLNHYDRTVLGGINAVSQQHAGELVERLRTAGIQAELASSIQADLWEKFTRVTTLAALTCLFRASVGQIVETDHGAEIAAGLLNECVQIAGAAGYPPRAPHVRDSHMRLTERNSTLTASMMRDMLANSRTEADTLVGDMARRGRSLGIATPLLDVAWTNLQVYETRRMTS